MTQNQANMNDYLNEKQNEYVKYGTACCAPSRDSLEQVMKSRSFISFGQLLDSVKVNNGNLGEGDVDPAKLRQEAKQFNMNLELDLVSSGD